MKEPLVSVIIPAHNNLDFLQSFLPHNLRILQEENISFELIVVDDSSSEDPEAYLKSLFPSVTVVHLKDCCCFSLSFKAGAEKAQGQYLLSLNCDVLVTPGFLENLLIPFTKQENIFATSPRILIPALNYADEAYNKMQFRDGFYQRYQPFLNHQTDLIEKNEEIFFSVGAAALYSAEKFHQLSGFDPLFCPFYWEDIDLGFRAWCLGWSSLYIPSALVIHQHRGTINKLPNKSQVDGIDLTNCLLWHWKNLQNFSEWMLHLYYLSRLIRQAVFVSKYRAALVLAFKKIFIVIEKRREFDLMIKK